MPWLWLLALASFGCGRIDFDRRQDAGGRDGAHDNRAADQVATHGAFVQVAGHEVNADGTNPVAFSQPVQAGDLILVGVTYDGTPSGSYGMTDTLGNSYLIANDVVGAPSFTSVLAYAISAGAGSDTITGTLDNASNTFFDLDMWEYTGIAPNDSFVATTAANGSAAGPDSAMTPAITTTALSSLLFAFVPCGCESTNGTGFTERDDPTHDTGEDLFVGPGTYTMLGSTDNSGFSWQMISVAFISD